MPTIQDRKSSFRLRIIACNGDRIGISFSNRYDAENWLEEHGDNCYWNPEVYQEWLKENRLSMKQNGIFHIHKPLKI